MPTARPDYRKTSCSCCSGPSPTIVLAASRGSVDDGDGDRGVGRAVGNTACPASPAFISATFPPPMTIRRRPLSSTTRRAPRRSHQPVRPGFARRSGDFRRSHIVGARSNRRGYATCRPRPHRRHQVRAAGQVSDCRLCRTLPASRRCMSPSGRGRTSSMSAKSAPASIENHQWKSARSLMRS